MLSAVADLCALRESIAHLEALGEAPLGAGSSDAGDRVPLGAKTLPLDAILGGGLRRGGLHEITAARPRDDAAASAFALALAVRMAAGRPLVWIVDDRAAWENGTPYRPGLATHGVTAEALVLVRTRDTASTLWATEEALRAGAPVVITELWRGQSYDLAASRRLLLAARRKGATNLLVHVGLAATEDLSSAADTRFAVAPSPSEQSASAGHTTPIPGAPGFAVRLVKLRGGLRGFDRDAIHRLAWDRRTRCFRPKAAASTMSPAAEWLATGRPAGIADARMEGIA